MSAPQISLRKLQTKSALEVFSSLKEPINTMKHYALIQNQIINNINRVRENKKIFQESSKALRENFEDTFQLLDKKIQNTFTQLARRQMKKQANRSKSVIIPQQQKIRNNIEQRKKAHNVSCIKPNLDSKSTEKRSFPNQTLNQQEKNLQTNRKIKRQKQRGGDYKQLIQYQIEQKHNILIHKNLTLLSKKDSKSIQLYYCLICYKNDEREFIWQKQKQYLAHLKEIHQVVPEFEHLLEIFQDSILLSHAIFKGKIVNLLKNNINANFLLTFYLLHKRRYEQLYFCGCRSRFKKNNFSIFGSQQQFYEHLKIHQNYKSKKMSYYSHLATTSNEFITFSRNKEFNFQKIEIFFQNTISCIKKLFSKTINNLSYQNFITFNYLNNMQLISCRKNLKYQLKYQQIYTPIPFCQNCDKFEQNWAHILYHHKNAKKCNEPCSYDYNLGVIKKYMQNTKNYKNLHLSELDDKCIPTEELQILKAQFVLMKSQKSTMKSLMICAECEQKFTYFTTQSIRKYIKHIYLSHSQINPLNNYQLTFMLENALPLEDQQK